MRWLLRFLWILTLGVSVVGFLLPAAPHTNCSGNTEALFLVGCCGSRLLKNAEARPDHLFSLVGATTAERSDPADHGEFSMSKGRILVTTAPIEARYRSPRTILAVCDRPFTYVPRLDRRSPPAHAVAYSDGSCGLISVAEYSTLDLGSYIPVDQLAEARES